MGADHPTASILVVDDTPENLRLLSTALADHGYEARPVTTGREALDAARRAPPDLVLLDINMPEMSGYEVCQALKRVDTLQDVPVIFLTALSDAEAKTKAFEVGGVDYVTKPFQLSEVMARVKVHVALRQAQAALSKNYEQLRALEKLRDDLVHMVVHDLRTPLSTLVANLEVLKAETQGVLQGESVNDLSAALGAAAVLRRMTNDLLDVSRLEAGQMPVTRVPTDLVEVARQVCASLSALDRDRRLDVHGEAAPVSCDRELIHRVIENIVNNAIKHTPSGGRVCVRASVAGGTGRVTVEDEGPGVPASARVTIFDKFGTLPARNERRHHSVGLGLAFCKLAVEAHGGRIGVEPGVERGSVFWFELPA